MMTLKDLVASVGGEILAPKDFKQDVDSIEFQSIAPIDKATSLDVTFLINPAYMKFSQTTSAAAVIVAEPIADCLRPQIIHKNPYWAFAKTSQLFAPAREENLNVAKEAFIAGSARIGRNVTVYPLAFVGEHSFVGDDVVIYPGAYIGRGVRIGNGSVIRASVTVEDGCIIGERVLIHANTAIGADGFGFAPGEHDIAKIPQVGIVRIGDDVEIGAGSTIDRAAMGETVIEQGCKLDSSVHIAHNVRIGEHSMVCGGAAVAGSAKIGKWNILAGSSSINNHVVLGDRITIGGLAGVTKSLAEPGEYMGFPAVPASEWRRQIASFRRLKDLADRVKKLEQALALQANMP